MSPESPESDLKTIWQNQKTEKTTMTIDELHLRALKLRSRSRRDLIVRWIFMSAAAVFCTLAMWSGRTAAVRVISGMVLAILLAQAFRSLYAFRRGTGKDNSGNGSEPNGTHSSFLAFYRQELERQQQLTRQPVWQAIAVLLIIGWLIQSGMVRAHSMSPVLIATLAAAAGLVVMLALKTFEARHIQREIDALDQFEAANR